MRLKVIFSLVVLVLAVAAVVGCGSSSSSTDTGATGTSSTESSSTNSGDGTTANSGDGSESTTQKASGQKASGAPLTKAEFITQGDLICGEIPKEYEKTRQELLKGPEKTKATPAKINEVAAIPPISVAIVKFEELNPPKGEEDEAEAIIDALAAAGEGLEKEPGAPLVGPESPYSEFQKLTNAYGFKFCNQL
jgi:hypothetical protein